MTAGAAPADRLRRSGASGAVLSALLLALAMLPLPVPLVVLVALVPLWVSLARADQVGDGARIGAWFSVTFWLIHLSWMPWVSLRITALWPGLAWLGQAALLGLLGAGTGAGFVVLRSRGLGLIPAAVISWVGLEWVRGHLLGPLSFPWSGIALPLARVPVLVQPAAWGGETLLAAGVVTVNAWVAASLLPGSTRRAGHSPFPGLSRALLLVGVWAASGLGRQLLLEDRLEVRARAVLVQPAVPLRVKRGAAAEAAAVESLRAGLKRAEELMKRSPGRLVVFPETHLPRTLEGTDPRVAGEVSSWAGGKDASVLVGAFRRGERGIHNSLLHIDGQGIREAYDKVALVPGVERGPAGLAPGPEPRPLAVEGGPGPLICIESAWVNLARRQARAGAGWLLNVTNDAWLGEGEGVGESPAFRQHPWHLVLRAVETGRGALRVGNNGLTGAIDGLGGWSLALEPHRPGAALVAVESLPIDPLFVRVGDVLGPALVVALLLGAALPGRGGSSASGGSGGPVDPSRHLR